ncbi:hypothetical protein [Nocardia suismassiliense]|uniref:hypothetical protein n=1 Tax=Nocardia suismassiliense TaxID=2077092 RepID=UPI000D1F5FB6|nr:hypothetical protein [Nocardia suismassiliense]
MTEIDIRDVYIHRREFSVPAPTSRADPDQERADRTARELARAFALAAGANPYTHGAIKVSTSSTQRVYAAEAVIAAPPGSAEPSSTTTYRDDEPARLSADLTATIDEARNSARALENLITQATSAASMLRQRYFIRPAIAPPDDQ